MLEAPALLRTHRQGWRQSSPETRRGQRRGSETRGQENFSKHFRVALGCYHSAHVERMLWLGLNNFKNVMREKW